MPRWAGEGEIQRAIWREVRRELQENEREEEPLPSIIFDRDHLDPQKRHGCIDVIYSSADVWLHMKRYVKTIKLEKAGEESYTLRLLSASNTLPGNIFPFDVLRLPTYSIDTQVLLQSLDHMASAVGSVIGFGYYKVTDGIDEPPHERHDVIRAYIKLSSSGITMPFAALASSLPSHFVWEGVPHTTAFAGRQLLKAARHSADYPLAASDEGSGAQEAAASGSNGSSSTGQASTAGDKSSSSNKRKRSSK